MKLNSTRTGQLLSVIAALVWSLTSPGLKYMLESQGSSQLGLAFWRDVFIALACFGVLLSIKPALLRISWREARQFALVGMISIGIYHALWVWSIALNGAAVAVVMIYLFPTFVSVGAWIIYGEKLRWSQIAALAVSLAGCALLVRLYDAQVFQVSWLGAVVGLMTALTHTVYVLFNQHSVQNRSPWTSLSYTMLFGSITLLGLLLGAQLLQSFKPTPQAVATASPFFIGNGWLPWLVIIGLALGPTLGGYAIFTQALRYIPGRMASLIVVIEAPISTLLAVWLLHERLEWPQVLGMALILGAIGLPRLLDQLIKPSPAQHVISS